MEFRLLRADEIDVRVGSVIGKNKDTVRLLLYKDARADMSILDETVQPENWQRSHEIINGNLFCNVGIWIDRRGDGYGDWVWKQDVGVESKTEKEKGQASDAFKRACFSWGIGRELYTAPSIMFFAEEYAARDGKCVEKFRCTNIEYENNRIKSVTILAEKKKTEKVFTNNTAIIPNDEDKTPGDKISEKELLRIEALADDQKEWIVKKFRINTLADLTPEQYAYVFRLLAKKKSERETAKEKEGDNE